MATNFVDDTNGKVINIADMGWYMAKEISRDSLVELIQRYQAPDYSAIIEWLSEDMKKFDLLKWAYESAEQQGIDFLEYFSFSKLEEEK